MLLGEHRRGQASPIGKMLKSPVRRRGAAKALIQRRSDSLKETDIFALVALIIGRRAIDDDIYN
jgi:hypothetical protein